MHAMETDTVRSGIVHFVVHSFVIMCTHHVTHVYTHTECPGVLIVSDTEVTRSTVIGGIKNRIKVEVEGSTKTQMMMMMMMMEARGIRRRLQGPLNTGGIALTRELETGRKRGKGVCI